MIVDGTTYKDETPREVIEILEQFRTGVSATRIRVHYGDTKTGQDWGDIYGVAGRVSRSLGPTKIPLLIPNSRAYGGGGILDHCIVRIRYANRRDGGDLYRHPNYTPPPEHDFYPVGAWARNFT